MELRLPAVPLVDRDAQAGGILPDAHDVLPFHLDERRDVEVLLHRRNVRGSPALRLERVEMAFPVGIVDLDDDEPELALRVAAQEEAGRVEDVAEDPQVGDERDAPAGRVHALVAEMLPDGGGQVVSGGIEMIAIPEAQDVRPVATHQPDPAGHLVELGKVQSEVEHREVEPVSERAGAKVGDLPLEQVRPHAASSSAADARSSAAS